METSVNTTRDREFHKKRRKVWDNAFKKSLADYAPRIDEFTEQLLVRIARNVGRQIVLNDICIHYSYDVMSPLAFGDSMGFIKGDSDDIAKSVLDNIQKGVDAIGLLLHVPWLMGLLTTFSWAIGPMRQWNEYSGELVVLRKKMKNPKPDLFGHLLENTEDTAAGRSLLNSECRLIVGAGSDTTATALTFLFVHLALYPEWLHERNFVRANEFLNAAMMELRSVVVRVAHKFDIAFPRDTVFDPVEYFSRVKDHFVAGAPRQEIVFSRRSSNT
ncbi:hypothetical protein UA08_01789 [Talaromyces atroroseus]|uniref:Uncharacterized protein n=1 Tax=Talaromyces atroroseus TaxID=1441469 RepID=A0A1Q5QAT5_TALAT|nr:hypothetical protein UA08_01789 [Talaromyces atroroseus]OKL62991.1 hypothetical protein UA08_01789 [Talaromyces atroroseus]